MAGIPEEIIDQVRDRTDIVDVISRYIPLKKAGRNFKAPCPFHHEKTPSFMVSSVKQIYHCFGCGAGGNVFNFLMKYERLEFPEAVRELAKKAGIVIPEATAADRQRSSQGEILHAVNEASVKFFRDNLLSSRAGTAAREYLAKRKIDAGTVDLFKLGYAPKSWTGLLEHLKAEGFDEQVAEKSGLVIRGRENKLFDRFRDRIIFPICDVKGRIRGFGSRVMDNREPKYMNSPETFIYNKGSHLYGLNLSWEEIRDKDKAVIVEGYLDLMTPYQKGIKNLVASLGTALTVDQIRLLKRYANHIIVLFDADKAGEIATVRSLDLLVEEDFKVEVAQLSKGSDPDSFVNKFGPEAFTKALDDALDLFDYKLNLLSAKYDIKTLEGKAKVAGEMLPLISRIKNTIVQSGYMKRLSETLSVAESDLKSELAKVRPDYKHNFHIAKKEQENTKVDTAEKILAGLMLEDGVLIRPIKEALTCDDFKDLSINKVAQKLFELHDAGGSTSPSKLIDYFKDDGDVCACISELSAMCESLMDKEKSLQDCIQWIRQKRLKLKLKELCDEIKVAQHKGDDTEVSDLVIKYNDMLKSVR
ncbi:MAG: DNA primase [Candidatus Omnitrophota bacterium]